MSVNFRFIVILAAFAFILIEMHGIWMDMSQIVLQMEDIKRELVMRRK